MIVVEEREETRVEVKREDVILILLKGSTEHTISLPCLLIVFTIRHHRTSRSRSKDRYYRYDDRRGRSSCSRTSSQSHSLDSPPPHHPSGSQERRKEESHSSPKILTRENILVNEKQVVNDHLDEIALHTALIIEHHAEEEVKRYLSSEDYKVFLEDLKRRERQRLLDEVSIEIAKEKAALLIVERAKMQTEVSQQIEIERIPLLNKLKMEEYQRQKYQEKLQADAERLAEIERKAAARIAQEKAKVAEEEELEKQRIAQLARDKEEHAAITTR